MSVPWPSYLPRPRLVEYAGAVAPSIVSTRMDAGRARFRKRFTVDVQTEQYSMVMTGAEYAAWKAFHKFTINYGAVAFTISTPTGDGNQTLECNMLDGTYEWSQLASDKWAVSFVVEAYDRTTLTSGDLDNLANIDDLTLVLLTAAKDDFHTIIHTDLPTILN